MLEMRKVLLAKSETVHGTDAAPDAGDAIVAESVQRTNPAEAIEVSPGLATLSKDDTEPGRIAATRTFVVRAKGSGTAGTAPSIGKLLKACGFSETIVPATSVTYRPAADPNDMAEAPSITLYDLVDGLRYRLVKGRGNVSAVLAAGQHALFTFEMQFEPVDDPDDSQLLAPTGLETTKPPTVRASSFTIGGFAGTIQALELNMNNVVGPEDSTNGAGGWGEVSITDRRPQGSINPRATTIAARDWFAGFRAGTREPLSITVNGGAGNILTITAPRVGVRQHVPGERAGRHIYDQEIEFNRDVADDELAIAFT